MLPTSGYFRGVSCPDYEKGRCLRPYCHFHHYPRRDTNANQSQGLASGLENTDEIPVANHTSDPKAATAESVAEDQPTCSKSASSSPPKNESTTEVPEEASESSASSQSELLQQLVADAVKKALAENPLLAAAGVDPTSLIKNIDTTALVAQASAEINQTKTKKKYLRPPDTPSYNPTPIEELNKRKRSVDGCEKEGVAPKVMKYVPSTVSSSSVISDVLEAEITKSSVDSEVTDFSSDDAEEADKRRDDFDILEEVLAEHSQNNITTVKKKKKKSIGKISFNTVTSEKNVKNSAVILDAQSSSDLDSKSCDTSKKKATEIQDMAEGSYFLPPSPVFTSSSDGFGMFDSTVYTTSNSDTCSSKTSQNLVIDGKEDKEPEKKDNMEKVTDIPKKIGVNSSEEKIELKKEEVKSKNKGHSLLPQVVQTLSAPKMARRNVRNWTPQSRSTAVKPTGDPLDEILQLFDGEDSQKNSEVKESGQKQSQQKVDSPNCGKTYKVDLDKEILSLTSLSSNKKDKTEPPPSETLQEKIEKKEEDSVKESVVDQTSKGDRTEHISDKKITAKTSKTKQEEKKLENKGKDTDVESDNESEEHDKDSKSGKHSDGDITSKDEESCDSEHKRGRHRKKRKRDRSSSSDSEHSYHRKKRKKSHKRHRKYSRSKRKRKHRSSREDSDEDEDSDRDEEGSEDEKSEDSRENIDDDETGRVKKHKKHKKRGRHHKKYKYKRRRSKSKRKRNRSRSSSRSSSQSSSSRNRSRSRTKSDSESSDRSRSISRSPSPGRRKNKDRHKTSSSKESEEKLKRKNSAIEGQVTKDKTQVLSVPMPVDPSKIKTEKDLIPDLSIVKIEKDVDTVPNVSSKKEETSKQIEKRSSSDISLKMEKDSHIQPNNEISSKNSESHSRRDHSKNRQDRKSSTDSMSDKGSTHRRQSTDSKKSESETTSGNSKQEVKRRTSVDMVKKDNITQDSQGKVMSMFDLVIASTQQAQQQKTLKEISMFDSNGNVSAAESVDDDSTEPLINEDTGSQKDSSHSKSKSGHLSKSHSNSSTRKEDKSESKRKHSSSSSKEKSSSHKSSSSSHQSSSSSKHRSNSSSSKHSSSAVSSSTSSTKETHSSKAKEKSGVSSSTHTSGSNKHHSSEHSSSSRSQKSSSSSSSSRKKEHSSSSNSRKKEHSSSSKSDGKIKESSRNKRYSTENEESNDILDKEMVLGIEGGDSPLPDLSALDEIPQDDWEEMMNSSDKNDLQHLENLRDDFSLDDLDKDDPEVMEECMRMFNEYRPEDSQPQTSSKKSKVSAKEVTDTYTGKKRIARSSTGNLIAKKPEHRSHKLTPAQVMMERFKKMKEEHVELMKQLEKQKQQLEEQSRASSSSSTVSSTTSSKLSAFPASSTSLKSPPMSIPGGPKRRISHVPNVSSLLHAREKIKNLPPTKSRNLLSPSVAKATGALPHTAAHTVAKGGKRTAHIPKAETLTRPTIPAEFGSKVPQNIRQRYLNSFIDECLKFAGKKTAFRISMAEERVCYNRAASRMVYLNLAVNTLKRLRTQQAIGEAAQELLDNDPQFAEYSDSEEPSTSMKSSSVSTPSSSKNTPSHPINPNHSKRSHFSVLACGGQKGSWSIEKPKKNTVDVNDCLKGANFYKLMKKYVLTEEQLQENGYPMPDPEEKGRAVIHVKDTRKKLSPSPLERYCDRCSLLYRVDKWGFPTTVGPCVYHWGRAYKRRGFSGLETRYSCCGGDLESDGCVQATTHVSQNYNPNDLRGYVRTLPKESGSDGDFGVYALDCEMCYTTAGNELTRVTVIDTEGNSVYEQLVKPENPIIDYNTRFSGITESDMEDVKTTILDVQAALLTRFSDKTILVGHSLESDFQALKLIHDTVVDTSVVFPHKMGPPYKRALRNLASEILKKIIQNDVGGHDSAEDAVTCMHLMQWRVKEDLKRIKK